MSKIKLKGLEKVVKELDKTILIRKDDFSKKHINKDVDIKIAILHEGRVIDSVSTSNLIKGLIVLSNHYLEELEYLEDVKKVKTKLEKAIRKGAEVEVEKFTEDSMHMVVRINGNNKYNFYGPSFSDIFKLVENSNKMLEAELNRTGL